ncbi:rCG32843 [Rattus norvegicus]|uniref:RCG32843 n=1 Tax=Rattus norvegicus TaxID=10116 RepID=A6HGS5_RAT|nr:rCG32843 [Rattus norvegicus]
MTFTCVRLRAAALQPQPSILMPLLPSFSSCPSHTQGTCPSHGNPDAWQVLYLQHPWPFPWQASCGENKE